MFILLLNIKHFNENGDQLVAYLSRLSRKPCVLVISETRFSEEFHSNIKGMLRIILLDLELVEEYRFLLTILLSQNIFQSCRFGIHVRSSVVLI